MAKGTMERGRCAGHRWDHDLIGANPTCSWGAKVVRNSADSAKNNCPAIPILNCRSLDGAIGDRFNPWWIFAVSDIGRIYVRIDNGMCRLNQKEPRNAP